MPHSPHILVVDDDPKIRNGISKFFEQHGLRVTVVADGTEMRDILSVSRIDLIILDIMLTGENGISLLKDLSGNGNIPVIMLTALASETDRVIGLEIGAEDYICKPFSLRELLARVRVVVRRRGNFPENAATRKPVTRFIFDGWSLDVRTRTLTSRTGGYVALTTGELDLLRVFVETPNRILTRDQLLDLAHGRSSIALDRAIDVEVMRLRRKIEIDPQNPQMIKTVRNGGYIFTPIVSEGCAQQSEHE
ncbi:MAG: response regulator [Rhizobiales bacterium]|nr:response regulator [Hyphomicrobiales bacterium]